MTHLVDLVADLGEGFGAYAIGDDEALLDVVTSANIACGFHAGDPRTMDATMSACAQRGIAPGAHPSFPDLVGFGRRAMELTPGEVRTDVLYQIGALQAFATAHGTQVNHVAPHGRLGNLVATRADYASAVAEAVAALDGSLIVLAQDGELADAARARGLAVGIVGIADRAYTDDGTLVPRQQPGAVIHDAAEIAKRAVGMVTEGVVRSVGGKSIPVECDTVLLHGDSPDAVAAAHAVRKELIAADVSIAPLADVLRRKKGV